jgi:hypothetical protein
VCVLGLCTLLQLATKRPHDIAHVSDKLLPSACMLLESLEKVYAARAQEDEEDDDDDDFEDAEGEIDDFSEDDEEDEKKSSRKMNGGEKLEELNGKSEDDDSDLDDYSDDEFDEYEGTLLENYSTCIDNNDEVDEFVIFKDTLQSLQSTQPQFYEVITSSLTPDQCKLIQNFITTANRRLSEKESRKILASGGFNFASLNVPSTFNFGNASATTFSPQ